MKQINSLSDLKKQDVILMGYKKKRKFKIKEQFEYYKKRSDEDKAEYKRFWEWAINEGIVYEINSKKK